VWPASPAHSDGFVSFPGKVGHPFLRGKQNQFYSSVLKNVGRHQLYLLIYSPRYYVHKPCPLFTCAGDRITVGGEIFCTCPDRPWGPPSHLYNGYRVFRGSEERPGRDADPLPSSSAVVKKE